MSILVRFLVLIFGVAFGVLCVKYSYQATQLFGHNEYAEKYLGSGGTYSMWKLLGLIIIIGTIWYAFH